MNDNDPRRRDDVAIAELNLQLKNFVERYERDQKEKDEWHKAYDRIQKEHTDILNEIAPNYRRGIWIVSLVALGSIAYMVKSFWSHVVWQ